MYFEGNIAAGKTSLMKYIGINYPNRVEVVYEPVDRWRNLSGHNLLENFYQDPARNSFSLQVRKDFKKTPLIFSCMFHVINSAVFVIGSTMWGFYVKF